MPGHLGVGFERSAGIAQHLRVAPVPVRVIGGDRGDVEPVVAGVEAGAAVVIGLVVVGALVGRRPGYVEPAAAAEVKLADARLGRRPGLGRLPALLGHGEVMHRALLGQAGVQALQVLVEEAQGLGDHAQLRQRVCPPGAGVGARAVVPGAEQEPARGVLQPQVALDRSRGVAAAVHPAGDAVDRGLAVVGARGVVVRADLGAGVVRVVAEAGVAEAELAGEVLHVEVGPVPDQGGLQQGAVPVLVHRRRAGQVRIAVMGVAAHPLAVVVVEGIGERAVVLAHAVEQHAAGIEVVRPGVPDRKRRHHRLDRRVPGRGQKIGGRADVGDSGRADPAVAPGLRHDPGHDIEVIVPLARRAEAVAAAEGGAAAAHVDRHQRIAPGHEGVAELGDVGTGLDARLVTGFQREAPVIGREQHHRRVGAGLGRNLGRAHVAGQVHVNRQPGAVAHAHVARRQPLALVARRMLAQVPARRHAPGLGALVGLSGGLGPVHLLPPCSGGQYNDRFIPRDRSQGQVIEQICSRQAR